MQNEQQIRERAYQIWVSEGMPDGRDLIHWEQARRELEQQTAGNKPESPADPGKGTGASEQLDRGSG